MIVLVFLGEAILAVALAIIAIRLDSYWQSRKKKEPPQPRTGS